MKRLVILLALLIAPVAAHASCVDTPNLGLKKCDFGDPNWDVFTNANWDKVDFSCTSPLSCAAGAFTLGTVPYTKGGTGQTTTTKGDLLCGTATGWNKLAVGSNGKTLVADSAQTCGVKWSLTPTSPPFADTLNQFANNDDPSKMVKLDLSGIGTGTTREYSTPDADGALGVLSGSLTTGHLPKLSGTDGEMVDGYAVSGNTSTMATIGTPDSGKCLEWDADGNIVTAASNAACGGGGGGSGTVYSGGTANTNVSNSTTNYFPILGNAAPSASNCQAFATFRYATTTSGEMHCRIPSWDGTLLTGSETYTIKLHNEEANVDYGSCVIDNSTGNSCDATLTSFTLLQTELCFKVTPANSPTAAPLFCEVTLQ